MVYQSVQCSSFHIQPLGIHSGGKKTLKDVKISSDNTDSSNSSSRNANNDESHDTTTSSSPVIDAKEGNSKKQVDLSGLTFSAAQIKIPSTCTQTNGNIKIGGPFWTSNIHDQECVDALIHRLQATDTNLDTNETNENILFPPSTAPRILGILSTISEELKDVPFHYNVSDLASTLKVKTPSLIEFKANLTHLGYRVSAFHRDPLALKTDASDDVIWDLMRAYSKHYPPTGISNKNFPERAKTILAKESKTDLTYMFLKDLPKATTGKRTLPRFFQNPEENWGPKRRAGRVKNTLNPLEDKQESIDDDNLIE